MSGDTYNQRVQLHGGEKVHGGAGGGDVTTYSHTACNLTVISADQRLDPSTQVTCTPCDRAMKEGS